jgi:chaperonin GroES
MGGGFPARIACRILKLPTARRKGSRDNLEQTPPYNGKEFMMELKSRKKIILVGDKVLIAPDKENERTAHGLYLPPGVKEKEKVQSGFVSRVGPGYAVPNPQYIDQESWSTTPKDPVKYIPLQAEEGDYAIFMRDAAIEVEYEGEKYLIVPHSSILMLLRPGGIDELIR